jgi:hypothetical protein
VLPLFCRYSVSAVHTHTRRYRMSDADCRMGRQAAGQNHPRLRRAVRLRKSAHVSLSFSLSLFFLCVHCVDVTGCRRCTSLWESWAPSSRNELLFPFTSLLPVRQLVFTVWRLPEKVELSTVDVELETCSVSRLRYL